MTEETEGVVVDLGQVVTREQAPAALERLRADRASGKIHSEHHYLERSEYLHGVMAADPAAAQPAAPKAFETQDERLEQSYADQMQAPKPEHYTLPQAAAFKGNDQVAFDAGVRAVFHRGGVPQHLAAPILEGVIGNFDTLAGADEDSRQAKLSESQAVLRKWWGDDFDARFSKVNDLVADMLEASPELGEMFDNAPWLFAANPAVMDYLDRVAQHRANKKA
jgi:hypothetical protein